MKPEHARNSHLRHRLLAATVAAAAVADDSTFCHTGRSPDHGQDGHAGA